MQHLIFKLFFKFDMMWILCYNIDMVIIKYTYLKYDKVLVGFMLNKLRGLDVR